MLGCIVLLTVLPLLCNSSNFPYRMIICIYARLGCAMQLCTGQPTVAWIKFCLAFINLFRSYGVRPIMVFDGSPLPSKKVTNVARGRDRAKAQKEGLQLLAENKTKEAVNHHWFQCCGNSTVILTVYPLGGMFPAGYPYYHTHDPPADCCAAEGQV